MDRIGRQSPARQHRHFLREWREHRGLSQDRLAERLSELLGKEIGRDRISKFETGAEGIREPMLYAIADALSIEPGWMFVRPDVILREREALQSVQALSPEELAAITAIIRAKRTA